MSIIVPPYAFPSRNTPNVTPLTYRDGITYLQKLELLRVLINKVNQYAQDATNELGEIFVEQVNNLISQVNDAIEQVINNSVEVQEPVVTQLISNVNSQVRQLLDNLFAGKSIQGIVEDGRLSENALNLAFASKTVQEIVESGRLSEQSLTQVFANRATQDTVETGRLAENALSDGNVTFSARAFGAMGEGVIDESVFIQAAVNTASALGGGVIVFPAGTYHLGDGIDVPSNITIRGAGKGVTVFTTDQGGEAFRAYGTKSQVTSLVADANPGDSIITVASTAAISDGDWLVILDDTIPDDNYTSFGGEIIQVRTVDTAQTFTIRTTAPQFSQNIDSTYSGIMGQIIPAETVRGEDLSPYTVGRTGRILKVTPVENVTFESFTVRNSNHLTTSGVRLINVVNATVRDVEVDGTSGPAVSVITSANVNVRDCYIHDLVDDNLNGHYGYGVEIQGASINTIVTGCTFERTRHGITTGGTDGGTPRLIIVSDCIDRGSRTAAFDTHGSTYGIFFYNCISYDCGDTAFKARARYVVFQNCYAFNPRTAGFVAYEPTSGAVKIIGCTVYNAGDRGIRILGDGVHDVLIDSCTVMGANNRGIALGLGNHRTVVTNCKVVNVARTSNQSGISFESGPLGNTATTIAPVIIGNTIYRDTPASDFNGYVMQYGIEIWAPVKNAKVANNVVWGNAQTEPVQDSGTATFVSNNVRFA